MFKSTVQITILSVVTILLSFVTQLAVAYYFGATPDRDAYFAALVIPTYISAVLLGSIGFMFLPIYVDIRSKKSDGDANFFLNNSMVFTILLSIFIVALGILFSHTILSVTAPGFRGNQLSLTSNLLIILLPTVLFQILTSIGGSVLQVRGNFLFPALAPVFSALVMLITVLGFNQTIGIKSLAYGTLIGSAVACFLILVPVCRLFTFRFVVRFEEHHILQLIKTSLPLLVGGIFYRLAPIFERSIASSLSQGSVSYLGYANQIMLILAMLTSSGISTTIYPALSKAWSENNLNRVHDLFAKGIRIILLISIPISVVFIFWGVPIIQLLFERGAFTHQATLAISSVFSILTLSLIASSLGNIIAKVFYFSHRTILSTTINCLEVGVYVLLAYTLSSASSYRGLAIASSASTCFSISMSFISLCVILTQYNWQQTLKDIFLISIAGLIPGYLLNQLVHFSNLYLGDSFFYTGSAIFIYGILYFLLLIAFRFDETELFTKAMKPILSLQKIKQTI